MCGSCKEVTCDRYDGSCTVGCSPGYKTTTMCIDGKISRKLPTVVIIYICIPPQQCKAELFSKPHHIKGM